MLYHLLGKGYVFIYLPLINNDIEISKLPNVAPTPPQQKLECGGVVMVE